MSESSTTGRNLGVMKTAAVRAGLTLDEYLARVNSGQKRCTRCKVWKPRDDFATDRSRGDGLKAKCNGCVAAIHAETYAPVPADQRKPKGVPRNDPRDGDKKQARHLINLDVQRGSRPNPNDLHCTRCGHKGGDRRHEYHHHMGYAARHHYDVIPLCSHCHHEEH